MESVLQTLIADPNRTNALAAVASVVIAFAALLVAAISIWLSRKALAAQEKHNQLSVKPLPFIAVADYENRLWVKLVNNGSGPLIVKSTTVRRGDVETESLIELMPKLPPSLAWRSFTSGMKERSILPGDVLFFIDLEGDPTNVIYKRFRDQCRLAMSEMTITVKYTDIYGETFKPTSRKLDWFGRLLIANKKMPN